MSESLEIGLGLDKSPAKAAAEAFRQDMKALSQGMLADALAAGAKEVDAARKAADEKTRIARDAAEAKSRLARRAEEEERGYGEETARALKRTHAEVAESVGGVKDASVGAARASASAFLDLDGVGSQLKGTFNGLAASALSIGAVVGVAKSILGAMQGANAETQRQLEKLERTKELIREISTMTGGKEGSSDAEVQKHIDVRKASGLTEQEAAKHGLEFHGAGEAFKGVNIPDAEFKRAEMLSARLAATAGGGPDAAGVIGKMSGLLLGFGKVNTAEELLAKSTQFNKTLSVGVGDNPTLMKQGFQVAGSYINENGTGIMKDERELAAVTAVASRINPDTAAETMKSTTRVLRGFSQKWAPMLAEAGITEHDKYGAASDKLFALMEKAEKSGRSVDAYLAEQGVDQAGAEHTMAMYSQRKLLGRLRADNETRMTAKEAVDEQDTKFKTDVTLRNRVEQARLDEAKLHNAMPLQYAKGIELEAKTRIEKRGEGEGSAAARVEDLAEGKAASTLGLTLPPGMSAEDLGRKIRVEQEMHRVVTERGQTVPGRPDRGLQRGTSSDAAYLGWLLSGSDTAAYSAAGSEREMVDRVTPAPRPEPPGPRPNGMDTGWKRKAGAPVAPPPDPNAPKPEGPWADKKRMIPDPRALPEGRRGFMSVGPVDPRDKLPAADFTAAAFDKAERFSDDSPPPARRDHKRGPRQFGAEHYDQFFGAFGIGPVEHPPMDTSLWMPLKPYRAPREKKWKPNPDDGWITPTSGFQSVPAVDPKSVAAVGVGARAFDPLGGFGEGGGLNAGSAASLAEGGLGVLDGLTGGDKGGGDGDANTDLLRQIVGLLTRAEQRDMDDRTVKGPGRDDNSLGNWGDSFPQAFPGKGKPNVMKR